MGNEEDFWLFIYLCIFRERAYMNGREGQKGGSGMRVSGRLHAQHGPPMQGLLP